MRLQYRALMLLAIFAVCAMTACAILSPSTPTPIPFDRYSAQNVFDAFARAGLQIQNPEKNLVVTGRGAPGALEDRYLFEIPRIAPAGGQIIIFASADQLQAWQTYIDKLRASSDTRRDVVYTFVKDNVLLQLNPALTTAEANAYRDAFMALP